MEIFLDMDGVMCDWDRSCLKLFGRDPDWVYANRPLGIYELTSLGEWMNLGDRDEIFRKIEEDGAKFWETLEEYPWSRTVYEECRRLGQVYFLSKPTDDPACVAGKLAWIHKFTGDSRFRNYVFTSEKYLCSGPNRVLVDDCDSHVMKFVEANEEADAILFPRRYNSRNAEADDYESVLADLRTCLAKEHDRKNGFAAKTKRQRHGLCRKEQ